MLMRIEVPWVCHALFGTALFVSGECKRKGFWLIESPVVKGIRSAATISFAIFNQNRAIFQDHLTDRPQSLSPQRLGLV